MDTAKENKNICIDCRGRIESLHEMIKLTDSERALLSRPRRVFTFGIPVRMDNGEVKVFNGYRVQYNDALGPTKGGIRYHEEVDLEEVKTLSFLMALKCSLADLPFGGGKGGIEVNPKELSVGELERLTRGYIREIHQFIGPRIDVPAPDVNTNGQIMAWFVDEYSKIKGQFTPAVVTGKPIELGGSLGREEATALGGAFVLENFLKSTKKYKKGLKVAIQGFGNVGGNMAKILDNWGYKVVAISDVSGAIYDDKGLSINKVCDALNGHCRPENFKGGKKITNEELLLLPVDILIPAALSKQITSQNADKIKAKIVVEMANAPVTEEADVILEKKGIPVIPDILANAGGVIVSYFEWVQNSSNEYWTKERVNKSLEEKIGLAFNKVFEFKTKNKMSFREACYGIAIDRILKAEKLRGTI
jgi:glutamate dehydrogenase/glutamate dehydrogenase (NAD(P)+)